MSKEAKVGLLVAILSSILLAMAPRQGQRAPILGTVYRLSFHNVDGLKPGDQVVMGGVPAGRVVNIDFAPREDWAKLNQGQPDVPMVLVSIALDNGFNIPVESGYRVTATLKGQVFINVVPGPPGENISAGAVLTTELPAETDDTLGATLRNFRTLSRRTEDMRKQFSDPAFRRQLKDGASNARFYTNEFMTLSKTATSQVDDMNHQLDVQQVALAQQSKLMLDRINALQSYINQTIPVARAQLADYRGRLAAAQGQLGTLYSQADKMNATLKDLSVRLDGSMLGKFNQQKMLKQAKALATRADDISALAGDIHAITSDEQVRHDIKAVFKKFKGQSESVKATVDNASQSLEQYRWLMIEEKRHREEP